jgi:hypothetical protein
MTVRQSSKSKSTPPRRSLNAAEKRPKSVWGTDAAPTTKDSRPPDKQIGVSQEPSGDSGCINRSQHAPPREVTAPREEREGWSVGQEGRWAVGMRWGPANQPDISGLATKQHDHICVFNREDEDSARECGSIQW